MKKLFGTDGIRGLANEYPMTAELALQVGKAVATYFAGTGDDSKFIIGKDTRLSGDMLESAIVAGICAAGGKAYLTGAIPTPAVAFITSSLNAAAGIVISASHNPYHDNGIKIFRGDGFKLSDETEAEIESLILKESDAVSQIAARNLGTARRYRQAEADYMTFLKNTLPKGKPFEGIKIVLDCSNGATYRIAPELFAALGADIEALGVQPDGVNINDHCGSEHPEMLMQQVAKSGAAIGLAFDGDGDRLIAVDETGKVLTGDHILAICARYLKQKDKLKNNRVVSTVMSNLGFGVALKAMEIDHEIAQVGDRYVVERMVATGSVIGGEDSGHMIFSDYHSTGDGILTALRLIEAMQNDDKPLSELSNIMTVYPQVLMNIKVKHKPPIETVPRVIEAIQSVENELGEKGRVLVRYSGTQPLCRVMVEGSDEGITRGYCKQIADIIVDSIGNKED